MEQVCATSLCHSSSIGCAQRDMQRKWDNHESTHIGCLKNCSKYSQCSDDSRLSLKGGPQRHSAQIKIQGWAQMPIPIIGQGVHLRSQSPNFTFQFCQGKSSSIACDFSSTAPTSALSNKHVAPMMAFFNRILDIEDRSALTADISRQEDAREKH